MQRWLGRLFPQVRSPEWPRFQFFLALSLLLTLAQTIGLVLSESLLLARYGPGSLPLSFLLAALATMLGSLVYALGVERAKNDLYFIRLLAWLSLGMALTWYGVRLDARGVLFALMCVYFVSQCIVQNHFWTFTGDFFDTLAAKRVFPLFVVGSSLGGVLGASLLGFTGQWMAPEQQLLLWPACLLLAAGLIRLYRRPLRRWGPLELEEADETSLSEMRNAANYLRQSSLGRQLVGSCACMILAAFIGQYLYSGIILQNYPDPQRLAGFLSLLLTVTNTLEILVEGVITPYLIRTMGVANANQVHSGLTCASFLALTLHPSLLTAVCLRTTRESLENAIASPVRSLVYNALPARSRGRVRAFLEGVVTYAAMAVAGVILGLVGDGTQAPDWMFWLGEILALLYALSNFRVRHSYLQTLITEVEAGRLDLSELGGGFTMTEVGSLLQLWKELTAEAGSLPDPALTRLAQALGQHQIWVPLTMVAGDPQAPSWLRRTCLLALAQPNWPRDWRLLQECATRSETQVRLAALQAVGEVKAGLAPSWLLSSLGDPQPEIRALASALLLQLPAGNERSQAEACLLELLQSEQPSGMIEALRRTPAFLSAEVLKRCTHSAPSVASAALYRLADFGQPDPAWLEAALQALQRPEVEVRRAALRLLERHPSLIPADPEVWDRLAQRLQEPGKATRDRAVELLALCPLDLGPLLRPYLHSPSWVTARAAVQVLGQTGSHRELLQGYLREQVRRLWLFTLALRADLPGAPLAGEYFRLCLQNARDRSRKLVFDILASLETPRVIRSVEKVLRFSNLRARADALEVLSNLGDREAAQLLVLLLESGSLEEKLRSLPSGLLREAEWSHFGGAAEVQEDPALARAARWLRGEEPLVEREEETVERLVILRKVPLFAQMNLDQLIAIDQRLEEAQYLPGEVVFEEGQLGAELYILLDGAVKIVKALGSEQELLLTRLEAVNYFGEMAILDDEPRSASVVVERNSRLLVLKGEQLKDLVEQMPEMAFEIIKVLTARIRQADERLNQMAKSKA